ncbi:MAG: hypothetical protein GWN99_12035 [Gemmatimonadetes bacterium]|uniref:Uncharacterized protein n=1 Tax=Candidatus Kutchimonas denitrificans TaxID=3056748 RepID=A0AAE4ZBU8_9BACT|nr:hypothetical protein [Gemmatimonadota bacterium]NIR75461.1 hypothetical protein [Candidatus Kutchimonas denitrificans]NIS01775.1 hypothetical protein [Gemmatimonadota bacterium]NIT67556.1 hypothetical protein [Gemmatimonadota bacterium]NIU53430.1 hypothetical protein [Gemmatimonadota bacterium]
MSSYRRLAPRFLTLLLGALACGPRSGGREAGWPDEKLEARVAEILPRLEEYSHLPARRTPEVRRSSRATLESYLVERLEQEYPGDSLDYLTLAYQSFGLLPEDVDLRTLLIDLLLEQAIGYYDPAQDVLFVREEAPEAMVDALIVHELVHALQDQHINLDSLVFRTPGNDARTAIQSAMEGHAMVAMMAYQYYQLSGSPVSVEELPELSPEMAPALAATGQFPQLASAPAIVREPLLFAYLGGARYVQRLWKSRPANPPPFGEWLPGSTEQLIHTERLLQGRDEPTPLVISDPEDPWRTLYARDLGELEIRIFFEEQLDDPRAAKAAAAGWDGDAYTLIARDDATALVWYTVWDSERDAEEFLQAYRSAFAARFGLTESGGSLVGAERQASVVRLELGGLPAVRIVESPLGLEVDPVPAAGVRAGS